MRADRIDPGNVAMLVQGDEVYGIGTIEKIYAASWPDMLFICLGRGHLHNWLANRGSRMKLVEGLVRFPELRSLSTVARMPWVMHRTRSDAKRIHDAMRHDDIRIVHAQWRPQQITAGQLRRYGYRSVWQINNNTNRRRMGGLGLKLNHKLARWGADLLLPASNFIAANWSGAGVPIKVIHNAASPIFNAPSDLPFEGPVRCLVAGRMLADKGHHLAVDAAIAAIAAGYDVQLDIYGGPLENNEYADGLRHKIRESQCEDSIQLKGFCDDLRQRHQQYHLGLQCRIRPEPCSLWVCETLVDGLPLVASASGGTPELVQDGVTGLLYQPGSASELTKKLIELCSNRERLAVMRKAAFERGQQHFTAQRFTGDTLAAYSLLA